MRPRVRGIAVLLFLVLGLQLGGEAARCLTGLDGVAMPSALATGAHAHDHCATPESPGEPGCPPRHQRDCAMMSHCALAMILPAALDEAVRRDSPATPFSPLATALRSFRAAPTPPPPRA